MTINHCKRGYTAWKSGLRAELFCRWFLRLKGYRILGRRVIIPGAGELDIIARRGYVLAFIEVKSRVDMSTAVDAVSTCQRRRIARAAEAFVIRNRDCNGCDWRFDVMLVTKNSWPHHIVDAWRP